MRKLIPQLQVLDEVSTMHTDLPATQELSQDWLMVKEAIKEGRVLDSLLPPQGKADTLETLPCAATPTPGRPPRS